MTPIHVDIVSAEGHIHHGEAAMVFVPAQEGEVGIAPRHAPLLTAMKPGVLRVETADGQMLQFFVGGGILEVQPKVITVLADTAIRGKDLDEAKASEALKKAEEARANAKDKQELAVVEGELAMLAAQLAAIRKLRKK